MKIKTVITLVILVLLTASTGYTTEVIEALAIKGFDPQFGARPVKRVIQKDILNELSKEILSGKITSSSHILLDAFDEKIVFRNK